MHDRLKLPLRFDPGAMHRDLERLESDEWIDHFVKQNYTGGWSVVPLRASANAKHPVMMIYSDPSCKEFVDTPLLNRCPYFQQILGAFQCDLESVRLMKLTPGSVIKEHRDHDLSFEDGRVRIHIPVKTNPQVEFILGGVRVVLEEGDCWYLRLSEPHKVSNFGPSDRIHLVIDAGVNDWIRELFSSAAARQPLPR
jgi:mannose-6-phosphate isomerase-like protein (cupin superfamily)